MCGVEAVTHAQTLVGIQVYMPTSTHARALHRKLSNAYVSYTLLTRWRVSPPPAMIALHDSWHCIMMPPVTCLRGPRRHLWEKLAWRDTYS